MIRMYWIISITHFVKKVKTHAQGYLVFNILSQMLYLMNYRMLG